MALYLYRRGDGNEGNFARFVVELSDRDDPYAALRALLANEYVAGKAVRRHIIANVEIDGEPEYGFTALVYEGPRGETAFDAAWLTAELQPLSDETDLIEADIRSAGGCVERRVYSLREILDAGAWRMYRAEVKRQG